MKNVFTSLATILFCLFLSVASIFFVGNVAAETLNGEKVELMEWEALMPTDYVFEGVFDEAELNGLDDLDPAAEGMMEKLKQALASAPIVPELDGRMIKIPGFVVPVEGVDQMAYTFFLVPYFGACIHVPPPPSNQMIYVNYEPGITMENLYDAVWVTGKLSTKTFNHEMASSGYTMEAFRIEPYEYEE